VKDHAKSSLRPTGPVIAGLTSRRAAFKQIKPITQNTTIALTVQ
jgi:hypothetical protein